MQEKDLAAIARQEEAHIENGTGIQKELQPQAPKV